MFYLIDKVGKNIVAWGQAAPPITDANTQEIVEVSGPVPEGFKGRNSKVVGGKVLDLTVGEKTTASQAEKSVTDAQKWVDFKAILEDNLAEVKTILGI